ncbi:alpha/beta fold hydrolase [Streptomyces sp. L7]
MRNTPRHGLDEHPTVLAELAAGRVEYRFDRRGPVTVVVFYGGHMRAGLSLGEEVFAEAGCSVLVPSRPGYGRTPVSTGLSATGFADVTAALCGHLGITEVAAVVGVSGGGPTAVAMAARHPALVQRLLLKSAVGPPPWPGRRTRLGARIVFAPHTERVSWALVHLLMRYAPDAGLRILLRDSTLLPVRDVVAELRPEDRTRLVALFSRMRSGRGFTRGISSEVAAPRDLLRHAGRVLPARPGGRHPPGRGSALRPRPGTRRRPPALRAARKPGRQPPRLVRPGLAPDLRTDPRLSRGGFVEDLLALDDDLCPGGRRTARTHAASTPLGATPARRRPFRAVRPIGRLASDPGTGTRRPRCRCPAAGPSAVLPLSHRARQGCIRALPVPGRVH